MTYYHNNLFGNVVAASDENGQLLWRKAYQPFGQLIEDGSTKTTDAQGFVGKRFDAETGLLDFGARAYSPELGRFLSIDPAEVQGDNPFSFNRYIYANDNPYKYKDPDGRNPVLAIIGAGILTYDGYQGFKASGWSGAAKAVGNDLAWGAAFGGAGKLAQKGYAAGKALWAGESAVTASIDSGKFSYLFGKSGSNTHNAARSNQLSLEMKKLGLSDNSAGKKIITDHLQSAVNQKNNILKSFSNEHGVFEVRDSLLFGPSGKAARLNSTFQVMPSGSRRFVTTIPMRGH